MAQPDSTARVARALAIVDAARASVVAAGRELKLLADDEAVDDSVIQALERIEEAHQVLWRHAHCPLKAAVRRLTRQGRLSGKPP